MDDLGELVSRQLRLHGLTHEVFDAEAIAVDLAERSALNDTLDSLVDPSGDSSVPTTYDPGWQE